MFRLDVQRCCLCTVYTPSQTVPQSKLLGIKINPIEDPVCYDSKGCSNNLRQPEKVGWASGRALSRFVVFATVSQGLIWLGHAVHLSQNVVSTACISKRFQSCLVVILRPIASQQAAVRQQVFGRYSSGTWSSSGGL